MEKQLRFLLLEDLATDAELIVDELELAGLNFTFKRVETEEDFLHELRHFKPDLVLSDYSLPTFNGMEALKLVKKRFPNIPVIMVTASINEETAVACMRTGAADYVLKDKMKRLGLAVRTVLENQRTKLQKKQAELALKESERYYRALLNQMHENVIVIDKDYHILDVNNSFLKQSNYERKDVIGRYCYAISCGREKPCDDGCCGGCALKKVLKTGKPATFQHQRRKENGDKTWHNISMSPMTDADGNIISIIESSIDVTELMQAQEEIQKLSTAIEQSPVAVVLTNINGEIEYVSPYFCKVTGYTKEEAIGQNPRILKSGEHPDEYYKELWETITAGKVWHGEFHNKNKEGGLFWEDATISPVTDASGAITHFLAVKEDITERKRLAQELNQVQKMEAIGRLAGGVSHDFNNLLTVINGYSEIALSKVDPDSKAARYIRQVLQAGKKASSLTQQLLAFSRKQVMQPKVLNLNQIILEMNKMLKRLIGENTNLQPVLDENLPPIKADPAQLDQIIINLSVNARDAMPDGGDLIIQTKKTTFSKAQARRHNATPGEYVQLSVSDTGVGMDEETKQRIFEPFFTTKEKGKGTGLGMATVYGIVSQNGWHIEISSVRGRGTTFHIYIPASREKVPIKVQPPAEPVLKGSETILFVEDEADVRLFVAGILENAGYTVLQAAEGAEALSIAKHSAKRIDLLLSDVVMPKMGGKKLADEMRRLLPNLKVIFISGYTDETISRAGVLEKEIIFLQKPFSPKELLNLVRTTLDAQ